MSTAARGGEAAQTAGLLENNSAVSARIELWADRDDDDADGTPDGEERVLRGPTLVDLVPLGSSLASGRVRSISGEEHSRVISANGEPLPWGAVLPPVGFLQGLSPGRTSLLVKLPTGISARVTISVYGIELRDGQGLAVDMARSHGSLERSPPDHLREAPGGLYDDVDALRAIFVSPEDDALNSGVDPRIAVESVTAEGQRLDLLEHLAMSPWPCAQGATGLKCWASQPIRFVIDDLDRNHPLAADRSVKAAVAGGIIFERAGRKAQMIRVLGPRASPAGPIGRLRVSLRAIVMRAAPGGPPAIGGNDAGAIHALRSELAAASSIWGQCGLTFGHPDQIDVVVLDPPPAHLVAIGDGLGLSSSGGEIRLRAEGRSIRVTTSPGETPDQVAFRLARAVERAGLVAVVSENARIGPAATYSMDVSIRRPDGTLSAVDTQPGAPLSTDDTLSVRIGSVALSDGLDHFTDVDSMAGTLEERTLLKGIEGRRDSAIEIVVVPLFAGEGRIGESFIGSDMSSIRNVVLLDRAGFRTRKSSLTLAHELGHVLMDLPGHPDDYGVDTPTLLMDSDASDESPFGPRRISIDECARVIRQAGPGARFPLLIDWPIQPIGHETKPPIEREAKSRIEPRVK